MPNSDHQNSENDSEGLRTGARRKTSFRQTESALMAESQGQVVETLIHDMQRGTRTFSETANVDPYLSRSTYRREHVPRYQSLYHPTSTLPIPPPNLITLPNDEKNNSD